MELRLGLVSRKPTTRVLPIWLPRLSVRRGQGGLQLTGTGTTVPSIRTRALLNADQAVSTVSFMEGFCLPL